MAIFFSQPSCTTAPLTSNPSEASAERKHTANYPIRYLLSFDDGPSIKEEFNPTLFILDHLAHNSLQPDIKAIFFVQTRASNGGGTPQGRSIMQREYHEGHLLAFHTATQGHSSHRYLNPVLFEQSLRDGIQDLVSITGTRPALVRPPFWSYDERTLDVYTKQGLQMILTDLTAIDGKIGWPNFSLRRRSNLFHQLENLRPRIMNGQMPVVDGVVPIIVTFHDPNTYTARHMEEYLQILVDIANELGLPLAEKPFYDTREDIEQAALQRTIVDAKTIVAIPDFWTSLGQDLKQMISSQRAYSTGK